MIVIMIMPHYLEDINKKPELTIDHQKNKHGLCYINY